MEDDGLDDELGHPALRPRFPGQRDLINVPIRVSFQGEWIPDLFLYVTSPIGSMIDYTGDYMLNGVRSYPDKPMNKDEINERINDVVVAEIKKHYTVPPGIDIYLRNLNESYAVYNTSSERFLRRKNLAAKDIAMGELRAMPGAVDYNAVEERFGKGRKHKRRTRRAGARKATMSEAQQMLRHKQIEGVQAARTSEIDHVVRLITQPRRDGRPHWVGPSEEKQERLSELLYRDDRLRSKGKGRLRTTRRR